MVSMVIKDLEYFGDYTAPDIFGKYQFFKMWSLYIAFIAYVTSSSTKNGPRNIYDASTMHIWSS